MELRKIWEIIRRRKLVILGTFVVIFVVAMGGGYIIKKKKPTYEATARMFVASSTGISTSLFEGLSMSGASRFTSTASLSDNALGTQVVLMTCRPIVKQVITSLGLKDGNGEWEDAEKMAKSSLIPGLFPKRKLLVEQYESTDLLLITAQSGDRKEAMDMVNTLLDVYMRETKRLPFADMQEILKYVDVKLETMNQEYANSLDRLMKFKEAEKAVSLDKDITTAIDKVTTLNTDRENAQISLNEARTKLRTLNVQLEKETDALISASVQTVNPQIDYLKKQLAQTESALSSLEAEKTKNHPDVIAAHRQITTIRKALGKELVLHRDLSPEIKSLEQDVARLEGHVKDDDGLIARYTKVLMGLPEKEAEMARLQLAVDTTKQVYSSLLEYKHGMDIAAALALCNVRTVEPAELPKKPHKPDLVLIGILVFFLGGTVSVGLGFIVEYVSDAVESVDDVKTYLKSPVLGAIPLQSRRQGIILNRGGVQPQYADAFWRTAHNISIADVDEKVKAIMVTSACPNEGKTVTAANLGITLARHGRNVLVVDADFFKPGISSVFRTADRPGLTEVLNGEHELDAVLHPTGIEGLTLLACGERPPDVGRLLESKKMKDMVDVLTGRFDMVIFDVAPILAVTDTVVLAGQVKHSVLVVEARKTNRRLIVQTLDVLRNAKSIVLGVILNKVPARSSYYYGYYGGYDYGSREGKNKTAD